jgi:hypothetical protein
VDTKDEMLVKTKTLFFNEATTKKVAMVKGTKSMYMKYMLLLCGTFFTIFFFLWVVWKGMASSMHLFMDDALNLSFFIVGNGHVIPSPTCKGM